MSNILRLFFGVIDKYYSSSSRVGRFHRTFASSIFTFVTGALYSLAVVPLTLFYLDSAFLGLWVVISQMAIWFGLFDFGFSGSSIRFFVAPLANRNIGQLVCHFQNLFVLFCFPALASVLFIFLDGFFILFFNIPTHLQPLFRVFYKLHCLIIAVSFLFRPFAAILLASQKYERVYLVQAFSFLIMLVLAWLFFRAGFGLWGLFGGLFLQNILTWLILVFEIFKLGFLSLLFKNFSVSYPYLKKVVVDSWAFSLSSLGQIGTSFLQTTFLSRFTGLEAVALWNIGSKLSSVLGSFLSKFFESSFAGLSELLELKRVDQAVFRVGQVFGWTLVFCLLGCCVLVVGNDWFIVFWTKQHMAWSSSATVGVSVLLLFSTIHKGLLELNKIFLNWSSIKKAPFYDMVFFIFCLIPLSILNSFNLAIFFFAICPFLIGIVICFLTLFRSLDGRFFEVFPDPAKKCAAGLLLVWFCSAIIRVYFS